MLGSLYEVLFPFYLALIHDLLVSQQFSGVVCIAPVNIIKRYKPQLGECCYEVHGFAFPQGRVWCYGH